MTRVRRLATAGFAVPVVASLSFLATGPAAHAASDCGVGGTASISGPSAGAGFTVGQSIAVVAQVNHVISVKLVVTGPSGTTTVESGGNILGSATLSGTFTPSAAGTYDVEVTGNILTCTYASSPFSVAAKPAAVKPSKTHRSTSSGGGSGRSNLGGGGGDTNIDGVDPGSFSVPNDIPTLGVKPTDSPYSLPSVSPDGTGEFAYATPSPDVAGGGKQRLAANDFTPGGLAWGPSIAIALVLLLMSAHLTAWTRRQRFAPATARPAGTRFLGRIGDAAVGAEDSATAALAAVVNAVRKPFKRRGSHHSE